MVEIVRHKITTRGQGDTHDVTTAVSAAVEASSLSSGLVTVFVVGSTAAVTTIEYEAGAVADLNAVFEQLAPRRGYYKHHERWGDDNGSSHVRAAILGPSVSVPFNYSELMLGAWQQIVLIELDTRSRTREVIIQLLGEPSEKD